MEKRIGKMETNVGKSNKIHIFRRCSAYRYINSAFLIALTNFNNCQIKQENHHFIQERIIFKNPPHIFIITHHNSLFDR